MTVTQEFEQDQQVAQSSIRDVMEPTPISLQELIIKISDILQASG